MTRNVYILLAAGGSAALLLAAFAFQHLGGMAPCALCIWQRWPHVVAVGLGVLTFALGGRILALLGALAALSTGSIGVYHTGVERGWWQGPATCSSGDIGNLTAEQLLEQIMAAPLVRCDEVPWEMLGLSMASWNAVAAFVLAGFWMMAARSKSA